MQKISTELAILIHCIKVVLLNSPTKTLKNLVKNEAVDWKRLQSMIIYHQVQPIVYEAFNKINIKNSLIEKTGTEIKVQLIHNISNAKEGARVLHLLANNGIKALPYKGLLFVEQIYHNKPLRVIGDFDIIVSHKQAKEALLVLVADGYVLNCIGEPTPEFIEEIIRESPSTEIGLDKNTIYGLNIHIDFHWDIVEKSLQYEIPYEELFSDATIGDFLGENLLLPSRNSLFIMLLNHHGGKECWTKLKNIADLLAFCLNINQSEITQYRSLAKEIGMEKIFNHGLYLVDNYFIEKTTRMPINQKAIANIIGMWEYSVYWDEFIPKLKLLVIYKQLRDKEISWREIYKNQLEFLAKVNPIENKRLFVFPKKYKHLNAASKIISHIIRKYF